jgi:hypothetical protein
MFIGRQVLGRNVYHPAQVQLGELPGDELWTGRLHQHPQ